MDPLLDNFMAAYNLGREIAIDESMIGFKGRLYFIHYIPKKPTKWGMKAFVLADSSSGYTTPGGCTQVKYFVEWSEQVVYSPLLIRKVKVKMQCLLRDQTILDLSD